MRAKQPPKYERWCSFAAWLEEGMCVVKGETSKLRSPTGCALFNEDQVQGVVDPYDCIGPDDLYGD